MKKGTRIECSNWSGICVLSSVPEILAKIIPERIKEHLENLIDIEQAGFHSRSYSSDTSTPFRLLWSDEGNWIA